MIVREIPKKLLNTNTKVVPHFALYSDYKGINPLLLDLINESNMDPVDFVSEKVIKPFLKLYLRMAIDYGITFEAHGQNVLIDLDTIRKKNPQFYLRDLNGFTFDLTHLEKIIPGISEDLPFINSIKKDYHQSRVLKEYNTSINTYYIGGFLYDLDQMLIKWSRKKLILSNKIQPRVLEKRTIEILENLLSKETGSNVKLKPNLTNLTRQIKTARSNRVCRTIFKVNSL